MTTKRCEILCRVSVFHFRAAFSQLPAVFLHNASVQVFASDDHRRGARGAALFSARAGAVYPFKRDGATYSVTGAGFPWITATASAATKFTSVVQADMEQAAKFLSSTHNVSHCW